MKILSLPADLAVTLLELSNECGSTAIMPNEHYQKNAGILLVYSQTIFDFIARVDSAQWQHNQSN